MELHGRKESLQCLGESKLMCTCYYIIRTAKSSDSFFAGLLHTMEAPNVPTPQGGWEEP